MNALSNDVIARFESHFGGAPAVTAYAPGRVEVLGNHTDYNEGFVLSAAIDMGTAFAVSPAKGTSCRLLAADFSEEARFEIDRPERTEDMPWSNYVRGIVHGLRAHGAMEHGFNALFAGDIPRGAGLSSSAALEMSSALALVALYGIDIPDRLEIAKIGQRAEHAFAGVKCGLLDQVTSLFGQEGSLVHTDFRTLEVSPAALGDGYALLMCNTHAQHALNDSAYNERRGHCEAAAAALGKLLNHPVTHLRDVSWEAFEEHRSALDPVTARRAAHVIGENTRVQTGVKLLREGRVPEFGKLMYASHESSRHNFENSCPELDFVVDTARAIPAVLGARLSGGGFGGSAVILLPAEAADTTAEEVATAYTERFGAECGTSVLRPSAGARVLGDAS
ncbi:MAG: galactokinase [Opitutales bacterium]|nr:galactokinase [Opitutales bacterium]